MLVVTANNENEIKTGLVDSSSPMELAPDCGLHHFKIFFKHD